VRANLVVDQPVALALLGQVVTPADLDPVEVVVFERSGPAFDDAVVLGRAVAGPDMAEGRAGEDEAEEEIRLEGGPVVAHDDQWTQIARIRVPTVLARL